MTDFDRGNVVRDRDEHTRSRAPRPWRPVADSPATSCGARRPRRTRSKARSTEDGRGESIWDRFCTVPGAIKDGTDGAVACDHYHRFAEDIALMRRLNLNAYRFSIAWPRIFPDGRGKVNTRRARLLRPAGRLAARRTASEPFPTLYHWDLPQVLEDEGGWPVRATAEAFADYAEVVVARLGDRVSNWMTMNEPFVIANHGYLTGEHAPGRSSLPDSLAASHHVLARPRPGDGAHPSRDAGRQRRHRVELHAGHADRFVARCARPPADRRRRREPVVRRPDRRAAATRSTPSTDSAGHRTRSATATWS